MLKKTLESPMDCKEIKSILKEIHWTDVEAPILWPPVVKTDPLEKTLILGKTERNVRSG